MPYEYLDDVAIADVAFRAWAPDLGGVFVAAADATMNVMIEKLDSIRPALHRPIRLENEALDLLLFDLLNDILFHKDSERLLLRVTDLKIAKREDRHVLEATGVGEILDPARHAQRVDVKAVTLHHFALSQTPRGWEAHVILDI